MKSFALITGASGGIGRLIAKILFEKDLNIIVASRNKEELEKLKLELNGINDSIEVLIFAIDLSLPESPQLVYDFCQEKKINIEVLINNAGIGCYGEHVEIDRKSIRNIVNLNIMALTELCSLFGNEMKKRRSGYILNIASIVGFRPVPYWAAYSASKSYVLNFTEALNKELKDYNVSVTCFSPGITDTNFFENAGIDKSKNLFPPSIRVDPAKVAKRAVDSLFKKKFSVVYGVMNNILIIASKFTPRTGFAGMVKCILKLKSK